MEEVVQTTTPENLVVQSKKYKYRHKWYAYAMIAPAIILLTIFVLVPFGMSLYKSFTNFYTYNTNVQFVGFDNYVRILQDPSFFKSLGNVVLMTLVFAVIMVISTFLFACVLKRLTSKMSSAAKILIYLPHLLSGILIAIIFIFLFSNNGLINALRVNAGKERIAFAKDGIWPYFIIIFPMIWGGFGYHSIVMLAGMLNIPKSYYEAADMDGASKLRQMFTITIPRMKNYFVLTIISLITGGLQMFELPLMMTGGGPLEKTLTPVLFIYYQKLNSSALGDSVIMAGSILIMIPIMLINLIVFKVIKSEKSLDA